ncbi:MAG: DUF4326 domain-containing protein [Candidatus Yanofskybacteria bacterium]|nr:DUF4326 domain-containing protein [Candidatus Yanofskybacteria bacterium]
MIMTPRRIQRKRIKGWRMPGNAIYVGRPSQWGNPFSVKRYGRLGAIELYKHWLIKSVMELEDLRGKNLACWCKLSDPCHADILLRLANL